jgi:hypothetical protein
MAMGALHFLASIVATVFQPRMRSSAVATVISCNRAQATICRSAMIPVPSDTRNVLSANAIAKPPKIRRTNWRTFTCSCNGCWPSAFRTWTVTGTGWNWRCWAEPSAGPMCLLNPVFWTTETEAIGVTAPSWRTFVRGLARPLRSRRRSERATEPARSEVHERLPRPSGGAARRP